MGYIRVDEELEYISNNGIVYQICEGMADFNIIIDWFEELDEKFERLSPYNPCVVDYVFGDIEDPGVLEWIDERIERYENHERKVQFYSNGLCECYLGLKEEKYEPLERWSKEKFFARAKSK